MSRKAFLFVSFLSLLALPLLTAGGAQAYPDYSGCLTCHGDFRGNPYTRLGVDQGWGDDAHDVHRRVMLNSDCNTCHSAGGFSPVLMDSSVGGTGLAAISCMGCHGREADMGNDSLSAGRGMGLRRHHDGAGVTLCGGCHSDVSTGTPVGEEVLPAYYSASDAAHPLIPSDPCNPMADGYPEDYAGSTLGLDNDGNGLYDEADLTACPEPGETLLLVAGVGVLGLLARRRMR